MLMSTFKRLFEPGAMGTLQLRNRIVFPPIVTRYMTKGGAVSDQLIRYYAERAKGGAGLIVLEASYPRSSGYPGRIYLNNDKFIPGLQRLVRAVHKEGAKIVCEVNPHRGRADEHDPASPSDVPHPFKKVIPRSLAVWEIKKLEEDFGGGVRRVIEAGFDGIMIHGATGYLVSEFLSPLVNRRTDAYGGGLEGRARFALELVEVTRNVAGAGYPILFRLMADDKMRGGFGLRDAVHVSQMLQDAGVDAIDITAGAAETPEWTAPPMYLPAGCNAYLSEAIKKKATIPISVSGKINDPFLADEILAKRKADFVGMGRALVADPYLPRKAAEGRTDEIVKCIACQRCAESVILERIPLRCTVNPAAGREKEFASKITPAKTRKKVLVIGGGPAGMEAAIVAGRMGHHVTLWEAADTLGGQLGLAVVPPEKSDLKALLNHLVSGVQGLKITLRLGKKATPANVCRVSPDVAIVTTGSVEAVPDIPGVNGANVMTCRDILSGSKSAGAKAVIIGGGSIGCETAHFLAEKGVAVTIVFPEEGPMTIGIIDMTVKKPLLERLAERKVTIIPAVHTFKKITPRGMSILDRDGKKSFIEADSIVLACGARPDNALADSLRGKVPRVLQAGDCVEPRRLLEAIREGADAALEIG
jgi:2,4-dienoyl-CoA reductase-like NADH-dependent reductase (Old Yellow Enzyme family)/thioredoxin reductase